jgi:hypothetical protein
MAVKFMRRSDNSVGSIPEDMLVNVPIAAATVDSNVFIATGPCEVVGVSEVHTVAGSDGGAVTLDVTKCDGTEAPASGVTVLSSTIDLKGTANTVVNRTLTATTADRKLIAGERLGINVTGTLTALAGGVVTIRIKRLQSPGVSI